MAYPQYLPGATVVGISTEDGVVLGAEKRISYGTWVVSRSGKKLFRLSDFVGAGCAGMVADMQVLMREISAYVKILELDLRRPVPPNSIAKLMSVIMFERRYFPLLTQVIVAGVDGQPQVYVLDPLGSIIPDEYAAVGSGAEVAIGIIEAGYQRKMSLKDAKELAIKSIKSAILRDAASGDGVDIITISKKGIHEESMPFK